MITELVNSLVSAATALITALPNIFTEVFNIIYDSTGDEFTLFGQVLVATAGFALAWAGLRFIVSYVGKLLNATRGGRR